MSLLRRLAVRYGPKFRWTVAPIRAVMRKLLKPIFQDFQANVGAQLDPIHRRQDEIEKQIQQLCEAVQMLTKNQTPMDEQVKAAAALGWDYTALVRRQIAIEDRLAQLSEDAHTLRVSLAPKETAPTS